MIQSAPKINRTVTARNSPAPMVAARRTTGRPPLKRARRSASARLISCSRGRNSPGPMRNTMLHNAPSGEYSALLSALSAKNRKP